MPLFVTKVRCSFEVWKMIWPMIRNILIVGCNYMGGIYSPAKGHVETGKGRIIKTRYGVVASIFYLSICLLNKMVAYSATDCEVF